MELVGVRHSHRVEIEARLDPNRAQSSIREFQANASPLRELTKGGLRRE
jgi:hypothetical protein